MSMISAFLVYVQLIIMSSLLATQSTNSSLDLSVRRIAVVICLFNAGISTRGLQIAKALASFKDVEIRFFSWNGPDTPSYHDLVRNEGFEISDYGELVTPTIWNKLLDDEHSGRGYRDVEFLKTNILDCARALKEYQPHVIVHGIQPDAIVATQILGIPDVQYGPIPIDPDYMRHILTDIPDAVSNWFTRLWPRCLRRKVIQTMLRRPKKKHSLVYQAAIESGWKPNDQNDLNIYNSATCFLLTDLPKFYVADDLPSNVHVIGPMFADSERAVDLPPEVQRLMKMSINKPKVFVTMGSTGRKEYLIEAVKAVCCGEVCAIVAVPPSRCKIQDLLLSIEMELPDTVVLTESFLPARQLASWADVVVGHGAVLDPQQDFDFTQTTIGQGHAALQTAFAIMRDKQIGWPRRRAGIGGHAAEQLHRIALGFGRRDGALDKSRRGMLGILACACIRRCAACRSLD